MVSKDLLKKCSGEIRKVTTLRIWVKNHGFNYATVTQFLGGHNGQRQIGKSAEIIAALRKDGYLDDAA